MSLRIALACLATLFSGQIASAETFVVKPDGTGDFSTIQAAINASANGDVIELTDGTFSGSSQNRNLDYLGKAITVKSQSGDPQACVIDCSGVARGFNFHSFEGLNARLEGVGIRNAIGDRGGAIRCVSASPTISGCVISASSSSGTFNGAVYFRNSDSILEQCVIKDNTAAGGISGAGLFVDFLSETVVRNCVIVDNASNGVSCFQSDPTFTNCTISGNDGIGFDTRLAITSMDHSIISFNGGPSIDCSSSSLSFSCTDVFGNAGGDWIDCIEDQAGVDGNFSADPLFCDAATGDYTLRTGSPCAPPGVTGCGLVGALPVGCGPISVESRSWGGIKALYRD